jgi:mannose-6-phosphate isomerase
MTSIRPLLLRADNFTPPTRTPWGGTRLLEHYKASCPLAPDKAAYPVVGESWEVSVAPSFPSRLADTDSLLADVIARNPEGMLGTEVATRRDSTALLVKLLDAADELSVQIHPSDDYERLSGTESGKPESWYVLEAEPNAGLYLGLREGVTREQMAEALRTEGDVSQLLTFVPVEAGDFFVIDAGTPHAIGRGVTLVEPQRVLPGRHGVTYRYWDWNRRYDSEGRPDPEGNPRSLHVTEALEVTDWDAPRGDALLERIRLRCAAVQPGAQARLDPLSGPEGPVQFAPLQVWRLAGDGTTPLGPWPTLRALTVAEGAVRLRGDGFELEVPKGRSAVLPANLEVLADCHAAHAVLASAD